MTPEDLECDLIELEKSLEISITIHDLKGAFRTRDGQPLLATRRQSHRKNVLCSAGFSDECVNHCRTEVHELFSKSKSCQTLQCWKGLSEVVFPMNYGSHLVGVFFAGIWKSSHHGSRHDKLFNVLKKQDEFNALTTLSEEREREITSILSIYVQGLSKILEEQSRGHFRPGSREDLVRQFISERGADAVRLEDLANYLHLSPSRTTHLLRELFDSNFREMIMNNRISRATVLLRSTDLPIGVIASRCGIVDLSHFNHTFKKIMEMSPSAYRKQER